MLTEVKHLKQLVRNVVDPLRDLGHVDRNHSEMKPGSTAVEKPLVTSSGQSLTKEAEESCPLFNRK